MSTHLSMNECLFTYTLAVTIKMHAVHTLHSMYKYSNYPKNFTNATLHNALLSSDSDHHKGKMGNVVTENPNRSLESP